MDYERLLTLSTELGYRLMLCGAEIYRVEESVQRILLAYGAENGEVFAIPNCIIAGLTTGEGHPMTRIRRVPTHGTDIERLELYNDLCRHLCTARPPLDEFVRRMEETARRGREYGFAMRMGGYVLGAGVFALFFGGSWQDSLCAGLCGLALGLCLTFMSRLGTNLFFKTIAGGVVSALLALGLTYCGLGINADLIIIGALMLLVPGILFTNAMRDIMAGDMMAGISRTAEALLMGGAIALGTGAALWLARLLWG